MNREYVILQSEFYTKPDPQNRRVEGVPLHVLDTERLRASQPNHTVFNGVHDGMIEAGVKAEEASAEHHNIAASATPIDP